MRSWLGLATIMTVSLLTGCASTFSVHATKTASVSVGKMRIKLTKLPPQHQLGTVDAVVAPSARQAWAIGESFAASEIPLLERWNGASWQRVTIPGSVSRLTKTVKEWEAIASNSPGNVWIFGQTGQGLKVWVHLWHGRFYAGKGELPRSSFVADAVAASGDSVWAFENPTGPDSPMYAWRYFHGRGTRDTLPGQPAVSVVGAAAVTSTNIWAVGAYNFGRNTPGGALFHYVGGRWRRIALPGSIYRVSNVVACGPNCAWVGGAILRAGRVWQAVARWNGSSWRLILPPVPSLPRKPATGTFPLVPDGRGGFWASGVAVRKGKQTPSLWHHSSAGAWKAALVGNESVGNVMAWVKGTTSIWAEGFSVTNFKHSGPILALIADGR